MPKSPALEFLQPIYMDKSQFLSDRIKAAEVALDYEIERCLACGEPIETEIDEIGFGPNTMRGDVN